MPRAEDVFDALKYRVVVDAVGTRRYYDDAGQLHRKNGPAVEYRDGYVAWYQCGMIHRTNGPAIEWHDGSRQWFLYGREYTESAFHEKLKKLGPCNDH